MVVDMDAPILQFYGRNVDLPPGKRRYYQVLDAAAKYQLVANGQPYGVTSRRSPYVGTFVLSFRLSCNICGLTMNARTSSVAYKAEGTISLELSRCLFPERPRRRRRTPDRVPPVTRSTTARRARARAEARIVERRIGDGVWARRLRPRRVSLPSNVSLSQLVYQHFSFSFPSQQEAPPAAEPAASDKCRICLDTLSVRVCATTVPCGHRFHLECLALAVAASDRCPLCQTTEVSVMRLFN